MLPEMIRSLKPMSSRSFQKFLAFRVAPRYTGTRAMRRCSSAPEIFDAKPRGETIETMRLIMKDGKIYKNTLRSLADAVDSGALRRTLQRRHGENIMAVSRELVYRFLLISPHRLGPFNMSKCARTSDICASDDGSGPLGGIIFFELSRCPWRRFPPERQRFFGSTAVAFLVSSDLQASSKMQLMHPFPQ